LLFILKCRGQQIDVVSPSVFRFVEKRRSIVALSGCGRIRRTVGSAVSVRLSVEPIVSSRSTLAISIAGISFAPVLAISITGASEPFLVTPKLLKSLGHEELRGISGGMAERFQ